MSDLLLETRIHELLRILDRMVMPSYATEKDEFTQFEVVLAGAPVSQELRRALEEALANGAQPIRFDVEDLARRLGELDAEAPDDKERLERLWSEYSKAEQACGRLFSDFVELIGGLAFRDRTWDEWFFGTADHLLRGCAQQVQDESYRTLAVPWMQDTIRCSLTQMIRLRFPDWTVWALPLAAFGFGRIYLTADREKPRDIRHRIRTELDLGPDAPFDEELLTLLADVFATGVMGPAYALAAMRLRLTPEETARARVILRTLELLGPHDTALVDELRRDWDACVAVVPLTDAERDAIDARVEKVYRTYTRHLREPARYPMSKWRSAQHLTQRWEDEYADDPTRPPRVGPEEWGNVQVPEVLNAAWYARWKGALPDGRPWDLDHLAQAVQSACNDIVRGAVRQDTGDGRRHPDVQRPSSGYGGERQARPETLDRGVGR